MQAFRDLAHLRKAPLEFDADFETRIEQTVWDLQGQITELKEMLRKEQEETRVQVMKNLAKMQGLMTQTVGVQVFSAVLCLVRPRSAIVNNGKTGCTTTGAAGNP